MNYLASDLEYIPIFAAVLNAAMAPLLNLFESLGPSKRSVPTRCHCPLDPKKWRYQSGDIMDCVSPRPVSLNPPTHRAEFAVNLEQGHDGFVRLKDSR